MAKSGSSSSEGETGTPETGAQAEDSRFIVLDVPAGDVVTQLSGGNALSAGKQKQVDIARAMAKTGEYTRGEIAKHLTALRYPNGDGKVPYQIVFQACRGIANVKAAPRQAKEEAPAQSAPQAQPEEAPAE